MTGDRTLREYDLESGDDDLVDDPLMFLAQPDSLIISKELADRHGLGWTAGCRFRPRIGDKAFTVRGIMKPSGLATAFGGSLAIMDIYAAQKMFGRGRTFDRIDLARVPGVTLADAERELRALLGPGFEIQPPASRGRQAETILAGYTVMVSISTAFALFIGMFIIYNSFAIAVTQRRSEIGILRALGATERQIRWLFLGESAVLGGLGSIIGLGFGVVIARATATAMSSLAGDLYGVAQQVDDTATKPVVLATAVIVGIITSLVAAAVPARQAAQIDPVKALQKGQYQVSAMEGSRLRVILAVLAGILSMVCLRTAAVRPVFYLGYALTIAAALLLAPMLSATLAIAMRPVLRWLRPVEGALAADSLIQAPRRTSATVVALLLSVALTVAFAGMARASYASIVGWMEAVLNPDLFVMPASRLDLRNTRFPAIMGAEIKELPGVGRVQMFRFSRITLRDLPVMAVAMEMQSVGETSGTSR